MDETLGYGTYRSLDRPGNVDMNEYIERRQKMVRVNWRGTAQICKYRTYDAQRTKRGNPLCSALHPHIMRCTFSRCPYQLRDKSENE